MSNLSRLPCSRRAVLRGIGVAMALPWLESLPLYGGEPAAAPPAGAPTRLMISFTGNGFHSKEWWAKGEGAGMTFGQVLNPLLPFREKMVFVRGLYNKEALKGGIHSAMTGNMFSGATLLGGGGVRSGTSFDQILAQRIGDRTRIPSLVVGCEESMPGLHKDYSMIYSSHISWSSPTSPTAMEIRPARAFDDLFRTDRNGGDRRVVDAVLGDAKDVRGKLSQTDRHRFDEYLTAVHELEARINRPAVAEVRTGWKPALDKPDQARPKDGIPTDLPEYMRQMCDLIVLAFQTDTTRIASFKINNDHGSQRYPHLNVDYMIHHLLSHSDTADLLKVNQFYMEQLAYIAKRLDEIREGERTLLDNTVMLHTSSMLHGNHDNKQLPVVLIGGAGGRLKGGRMVDYLDKPNRAMCSMYLDLMDCMGVPLDQFGDSAGRLPGLLG
ncbi:hypothetical protein LBMAG53_16670 [Planctomycetota bacterium]|nr:hypothetical protein LBMAG53_16670 [Planctomycetota bacterium]